jgi:SAM-dependent methyltransferase
MLKTELLTESTGHPISDPVRHSGMDSVARQILEQHDQLQAPRKFPEALNFIPFKWSKKLQNLVLKLFGLILRDQKTFNLQVTKTFEQVFNLQKLIQQDIQSLRGELRSLDFKSQQAQNTQGMFYQQLASLEQFQRIAFATLQSELTQLNHSPSPKGETAPRERASADIFWMECMNKFYGNREEVASLRSPFLRWIEQSKKGAPNVPVLDLDSGRGEWLELLQKKGLQAQGVESQPELVKLCQSFDLKIEQKDSLTALKKTASKSLGAVTTFNLVERLSFSELLTLVDETLRVLRPGGVFIFETLNPKNIEVCMEQFWRDPMAVRLIPSSLFETLVKLRGFTEVEVVASHPAPDSSKLQGGALAEQLNELLYSHSKYALIGRRP